MAHYAVGSFVTGRSGSPYQFVSTDLQPKGPYARLDIKRARTTRPVDGIVYLFEMEDWDRLNPMVQTVTKIVASLRDIRDALHIALKSARWEMTTEHGRRRIQIVGKVLKTKFGYFEPRYDNGMRSNGEDDDPCIGFTTALPSAENPYGMALRTELAQGHLLCLDEDEIARAHQAGIAK